VLVGSQLENFVSQRTLKLRADIGFPGICVWTLLQEEPESGGDAVKDVTRGITL
jgi:hypothetical protein